MKRGQWRRLPIISHDRKRTVTAKETRIPNRRLPIHRVILCRENTTAEDTNTTPKHKPVEIDIPNNENGVIGPAIQTGTDKAHKHHQMKSLTTIVLNQEKKKLKDNTSLLPPLT